MANEEKKKETKKDFTDLAQLSEELKSLSEEMTPNQSDPSSVADSPVDQIDAFESLEAYIQHHPVNDVASPEESSSSDPGLPAFNQESNLDFQTADFPVTETHQASFGSHDIENLKEGESLDFPSFSPDLNSEQQPSPFTPASESLNEASSPNAPSLDSGFGELKTSNEASLEELPSKDAPLLRPSEAGSTTPLPPPASTRSAQESEPLAQAPSALDQIKSFSEEHNSGKSTAAAAFAFSLFIEGELSAYEKSKLLDLVIRENMGIREMDLEPQLAANRILIPRISEYAGILIVQTLRGTRAKMRFSPSDPSQKEQTPSSSPTQPAQLRTHKDSEHPAEKLPILLGDTLLSHEPIDYIETLSCSGILKTQAAEASRSYEYQELVEALTRELKYRAFRKQAVALLRFQITLHHLSSPSHYRLTLSGVAVKIKSLDNHYSELPEFREPEPPAR